MERGIVCEIGSGHIKLLMKAAAECDGCTACSIDGGAQARILTINKTVDCEIGDEVVVQVHPFSPYLGMLTLFVFPIVIMIANYAIAHKVFPDAWRFKEMASVFASVAGLFISIPFIRLFDRFVRRYENKFLKIVEIVKRSSK